jgi:hypothetical protein
MCVVHGEDRDVVRERRDRMGRTVRESRCAVCGVVREKPLMFVPHEHCDQLVAVWEDSAGSRWREHRCSKCGRLRRSRARRRPEA